MRPATSTLERLVPDELEAGGVTGQLTLGLHLARYEFAAGHLRPGRALDIACGVGYGTQLLAERQPSVDVLGVDVSEEAVTYARERYAGPNARFQVADATRFEDAEGFDSIVSLETVEHLEDPDAFLARLVGLLRPQGVLVASVPTTPSVDVNPHHLHDFTERSFRARLAGHGLEEIDCFRQVQGVPLGSVLRRDEARLSDVRSNLPAYYLRNPGALLRRIGATLRYGLTFRYITIAWKAPR